MLANEECNITGEEGREEEEEEVEGYEKIEREV